MRRRWSFKFKCLARKSRPQAMSPAWEARVASPQGDKPTVRCFRAARSLPSKKVGADFPRWHDGQPFIIYVLRPLERLAITLVSPQCCNEQRRGKRTHVEIVSRKRGDILAAIKLRKISSRADFRQHSLPGQRAFRCASVSTSANARAWTH